jgi:NAD(P)H-hydrate epimerase
MQLVTTDQMRAIEAAADAGGHSYAAMMQRAGQAVARLVQHRYPAARVVALCGPGNNGGDGLVAAAALAQTGQAVAAFTWRRPAAAEDPLAQAAAAGGASLCALNTEADLAALAAELAAAGVVVDALLGTGLTRPLEGDILGILALARAALATATPPVVVAVDLPSGLNADSGALDPHTLSATVTVTFAFPKRGQVCLPGAAAVGELVIADIGIPADLANGTLHLATAGELRPLLPTRPLDGHKGSFGRVLVVGGSLPYTGAVALAALAAYRSGAGLVTLALPRSIHGVVAGFIPEATFLPLPEVDGHIAPAAAPLVTASGRAAQAVLLGPGLGSTVATEDFVAALLPAWAASPIPWVVDADGLNLLARHPQSLAQLPASCVLTPHPGEMGRLLGRETVLINADRIGTAAAAAQDWGHVVVLKGAFTVVAAPDGRVSVNPFATPALATAGSGDVLAGLTAGLLAQGLAAFDAARLASWLHGSAGARWAQEKGPRGALARELAEGLPAAMQALDATPEEPLAQ